MGASLVLRGARGCLGLLVESLRLKKSSHLSFLMYGVAKGVGVWNCMFLRQKLRPLSRSLQVFLFRGLLDKLTMYLL